MVMKRSLAEQLKPIFVFFNKYRKFYAIGVLSLIIVDVLEVFPPLILKNAVDTLDTHAVTAHKLFLLAAFYMGIALVQAYMRYLWRQYIVRTSMLAGNDMRCEFFLHLSSLAPSFFKKKRVGELVSLASNDIQNIRFVLGPTLLVFCDALFYFCSILPAMIYLSPKLAMLALIPMFFVAPFVVKIEKIIQKHFAEVQDRFSDMAAESQESLGGVRVIKGAGLEKYKEKNFAGLGRKYIAANIHSALSQGALDVGLNFFVSVAITLLFIVGGALVINEQVTIGTFVAFHLYIQKMNWPMEAVGLTVTYLQRALASQERLDAVYAQTNPITAPIITRAKIQSNIPRIEVRNLTFYYPDSARPALQDVSFVLEPGMRLGIAGMIGSGKTTLLNCLARLEPVARGHIFIDGHDINDISLADVRENLAMVPQDSFLFSESILDNILYGSDYFDRSYAGRETYAEEAAKLAYIYDETIAFPGKFATKLGERGLNISGGQKQRVSIARALAQNPKVLIFDDCLSAVDSLTEEKLTQSFHQFSRNRSFLFSSHRISSLLRMDEIIVLHDGFLVEHGSVGQLFERKGFFHQLARQQSLQEFLGTEQNTHA